MRQVRDKHPKTARVVVGSRADKDSYADLLWLTHAFIPEGSARGEALRRELARVFTVQEMLEDVGLSELLSHIERLPAKRGVWNRVITLSNKAGISAIELARALEEDASSAAKVLQLVNSAFFGLGQRVTSLHQAVSYVGITQLRALAVTAQLYASLGDEYTRFLGGVGKVHQHSTVVGRIARQLLNDPRLGDEALAAGLLHDIGKLALMLGVPRGGSARPAAENEADDLHDVRHAWLGSHLARLWNFPETLSAAIEFHHDPPSSPSTVDPHVLAAVHVADSVANAIEDKRPMSLDLAWLRRIAFPGEDALWLATGRRVLGREYKAVGT